MNVRKKSSEVIANVNVHYANLRYSFNKDWVFSQMRPEVPQYIFAVRHFDQRHQKIWS